MNAIHAIGHHDSAAPGRALRWTANVFRTVLILFLLVDGGGKIARLAPYVEGSTKLGFPDGSIVPMGVTLVACTLLYVFRRTALLGALLLTAYFGGAVATHVHVGSSFWFPVVFAVITWGCLYVRDAKVRAMVRAMSSE